eukprot:TRINITY_DN5873_c0_g1_i1.p2 TRINITY_DN5873_c0_g1~~TRINITY_DN5873_c0_g1_i1.p2  ORF type:complete len:118 (-),score=22.94 TRINITY_DN5873_c0_g1_i1:32-385(-)
MPKVAKKTVNETPTREITVNLHKLTHKITFKRRAPRAIKSIKEAVAKAMKTSDVRVDVSLNQFVWSKGVKNVPRRVRVRVSRKRNEDEDAKEKFYSLVSYVPVESFKGLQTQAVSDE